MDIFSRQIPLIKRECQDKLKKSSVFIAGIGGLGSYVSEQLVRIGIGKIYICDFDRIDKSNIHRQILYDLNDTGKFKVDVAKEKLSKIGMDCEIIAIRDKINENFKIRDADVIVDCLDNAESKIILSKLGKRKNIYFVHGGVSGYFGQITVIKNKTLNEIMEFGDNEEKEILPTVVSSVASIQTNETLKILCSKENILLNKIMFVDMLNYDFSIVEVKSV
jgi:molybdopterin/thiamine biosynthesis adenylyltransferase